MEYVEMCMTGFKVISQNAHSMLSFKTLNQTPNQSILGLIVFIIDIYDFSRASEKLFFSLYADNTSVFIEGYEYDKLIEIMNNEMKKVVIWLQANGLVINEEKTHYMVFQRVRIKTNSNEIISRDNTILRVTITTFLDFIIDDQLK